MVIGRWMPLQTTPKISLREQGTTTGSLDEAPTEVATTLPTRRHLFLVLLFTYEVVRPLTLPPVKHRGRGASCQGKGRVLKLLDCVTK